MPGYVDSPVKGTLLPAVGSPSQESDQGHPSLAPGLHKAVPRMQAASLQAPCHAVQAAVQDSTLPAALLQVMRHLSGPDSTACDTARCHGAGHQLDHDAEAPGAASTGTGTGA